MVGVSTFLHIFVAQTQTNMKKTILLSILFLFISITMAFAKQHGKASYYSNKLQGHHTSDGGRYHRDSMTCAHRTYAFGTILKVRNPKNDKEVIVTVTDRGPFQRRLTIDLSYRAAMELDIVCAGIASVEITRLDSMPEQLLALLPLPVPTSSLNIPKSSLSIKNISVPSSVVYMKAKSHGNNRDFLTMTSEGR